MNIEELIAKAHKELIENGNGEKAKEYLLRAANEGSGHAAHELGLLFKTGFNNLPQDKEKSFYWLEKSLASGFESSVASDPEWFKSNAT